MSSPPVLSSPGAKAPRQFATLPAELREVSWLTPSHAWYLPVKRTLDFTLALVLLILSAPVMGLGVLLVKLTSRGPALYHQVRLGRDGRPFTLLKLRTMMNDAEAETGPVWSTENDCRVTSVGKLLRSTHLDEFPQLWNVVRGQMSLVGPRPERPEFVAKLDWEVPFYRERLKVRPGITGLAQVRLPADTTLESVRRKVTHDVYYVRHVNPLLDLKLLVVTAWRLFLEVYRFCWNCFVLPGYEDVEQGFRQAVGLVPAELPVPHVTLTSLAAARQESPPELAGVRSAGK